MTNPQGHIGQVIKPSKRIARRLRSLVSTRPFLYLPLRKLRKGKTVVNDATQLVIEGAPRCGNTWTEAFLRYAYEGDIKLAHHSHAAAHVKLAAKRGVPSLVLYREPDAAIRSFLAMSTVPQAVTIGDAFAEYTRFYAHVLPLSKDHVLYASFDDVTQRPDLVVEKLNARFGLGFSPFDATSETEKQAVFDLMDQNPRRRGEKNAAFSRSNPNHYDKVKALRVEELKDAILAPQFAKQRAAAHKIYSQLRSDIQ